MFRSQIYLFESFPNELKDVYGKQCIVCIVYSAQQIHLMQLWYKLKQNWKAGSIGNNSRNMAKDKACLII